MSPQPELDQPFGPGPQADDAFEIDDQDQLTLYGQPVALMAPGNDEKFNQGVAHVLSLVFRSALNARFEQMLEG